MLDLVTFDLVFYLSRVEVEDALVERCVLVLFGCVIDATYMLCAGSEYTNSITIWSSAFVD